METGKTPYPWAEQAAGQVMELTLRLGRVISVSGTAGEAELGRLIQGELSAWDYFCRRPDRLLVRPVSSSPHRPPALVALWNPEDTQPSRLVLLAGHYDTVGVEEYGRWKEQAGEPQVVAEHLAELTDDPAALADLSSGHYLFGRGLLDMKGGLAAGITLLHLAIEGKLKLSDLSLALVITPDEEVASRGMAAALSALAEVAEREGMEPVAAVNLDFVSPREGEERTTCLYRGVVGKVLLGITVFGLPTHVGSPFEGINAAALAGYLGARLDLEPALSACDGDLASPPPALLHLRDAKAAYDVMTPMEARLHLNLFLYRESPAAVLERAMGLIRQGVREYLEGRGAKIGLWIDRWGGEGELGSGQQAVKAEVISASELCRRAVEAVGEEAVRRELKLAARMAEERERYFEAVSRIYRMLPGAGAMAVVGFPPPLMMSIPPEGGGRWEAADRALGGVVALAGELGWGVRVSDYYPYISDASLLAGEAGGPVGEWLENSPAGRQPAMPWRWPTPVVTIGPWGKGAHSVVERVHRPYLTRVLPQLLARFVEGVS